MTVILATSDDDGLTWTDEAVDIDPDGDGPVRAFAPQLWVEPRPRAVAPGLVASAVS
jgi:hypothetical protein